MWPPSHHLIRLLRARSGRKKYLVSDNNEERRREVQEMTAYDTYTFVDKNVSIHSQHYTGIFIWCPVRSCVNQSLAHMEKRIRGFYLIALRKIYFYLKMGPLFFLTSLVERDRAEQKNPHH